MAITREELHAQVVEKQLITPILDEKRQIGDGSIDVRLGHQFLLFNKATGLKSIDPTERERLAVELAQHHQRSIRIGYGRQFFLHPGDFVIARTFEYVNMPANWMAYVIGRSSWGRLGVIIATATYINPKFQGTITLEIANLGSLPVVMLPLMRIAQLVFHRLKEGDHDGNGKIPASDSAAAQPNP